MKKGRYLKAVIVLILYFAVSNFVFVMAIPRGVIISYLLPMLFGMVTSVLFLIFFENQGLFRFAEEIEKIEKKKEKKLLSRFSRSGRIISTVIIGTIGGPVFSSLTAHLLLRRHGGKFFWVIFASIPSTILWVGSARGVFHFFFLK